MDDENEAEEAEAERCEKCHEYHPGKGALCVRCADGFDVERDEDGRAVRMWWGR
jgi:hypothetical protein